MHGGEGGGLEGFGGEGGVEHQVVAVAVGPILLEVMADVGGAITIDAVEQGFGGGVGQALGFEAAETPGEGRI